MKKFLIIIEKTQTGYSSYAPDLPDCVASGRTKKEVENNMFAAIQFHLEGLTAEGMSLPKSKSESEMLVFA